jgi:hypothetical protein
MKCNRWWIIVALLLVIALSTFGREGYILTPVQRHVLDHVLKKNNVSPDDYIAVFKIVGDMKDLSDMSALNFMSEKYPGLLNDLGAARETLSLAASPIKK